MSSRVVIREFGRSPELAERIGELAQPIDAIQRVIERGIERGEFRTDLDPHFAATVVYGVDRRAAHRLGARPPAVGEEDVAAAEQTLVEVILLGLQRLASDQLGESGGADVPAREDDADRAAARVELPAEQRRDADRAARLGDELQPVEEEDHRLDDLLVAHGDDLVHQPPVHLEGQLAGLGRLQPVGDRAAGRRCERARRPRASAACRRRPPARRRRRGSPGRSAFAAVAQPAISPPPLTGTRSRSSSGASSSSSSATVPWPAMTSGSSYGLTSSSPRSAASRAPISSRLSVQRSYVTISAP